MLILGIETSCDETAAAVVEDGFRIRSNIIASQADLHEPFGGVVPELASRRHVEAVTAVIEQALRDAGAGYGDLRGVAVTNRPGLVGSLLVGVAAAQMVALALDLPLAGVHHIEGHIFSGPLRAGRFPYPSVALVASGGHTDLYLVRAPHRYQVLGRRRDDAAGEAFDKGARLLGLGTGGGAALDLLARAGDPDRVRFPRARTDPPLDFSFSGLKTALRRRVQSEAGDAPADLAASYQEAIVDVLVEHAVTAAVDEGVESILVGGGVAANGRLQERLTGEAAKRGIDVLFPGPALCTDNAAMIAAAGLSRMERNLIEPGPVDAGARSSLPGLIS